MTALAVRDDPDEPNVNWLALSNDEVLDLYLLLNDDGQFDAIAERLSFMLAIKPALTLVENDQ